MLIPEPLQIRTPHDASSELQVVTYPLFQRMECGYGNMPNSGRLLRQLYPRPVKLTIPFEVAAATN